MNKTDNDFVEWLFDTNVGIRMILGVVWRICFWILKLILQIVFDLDKLADLMKLKPHITLWARQGLPESG